jgi:predicted ATPase
MRLSALICNRYRAFKERQRVELAPITIIIGKNGSGKSIFSRLPLLLAAAISENADGPLDISAGGIDHATSFEDLVNSKSALPFTLGAEISNSEKTYRFESVLRYVTETRALAIESFHLFENDAKIFSASISDVEQLEESTQSFVVEFSEKTLKIQLDFVGIFPSLLLLNDDLKAIVSPILMEFRKAIPLPSYLGPFRIEPGPSMRSPGQNIRELGPKGEKALEILADDRLRRNGDLSRKVSEWFRDAMGQEVNIDVTADQPQVRVGEPGGSFQGNLSDTGAGFSQCLPYVVQHYAFRATRLKSPILIVEQPELHLHPAAHGELADLAVDSVRSNTDPRVICIIETHSEEFIMRIRRRIAEGLPSEIAKILSINHRDSLDIDSPILTTKGISFDKNGNPEAWPAGVFAEALIDLALMRKASRDKENANHNS